MAENLAYKADSGCWVYDNDESNVATYGYLYDWETAKKVCPKGCHLPSTEEWQTLIDYLGGKDVAGGKLKATSGWKSPNKGATNESGFSALPSGRGGVISSSDSKFWNMGKQGYWWSASKGNFSDAWHCYLYYNLLNVYLYLKTMTHGFSVRCVKD